MLTYQRTNILELVRFCDANFVGYMNDKKSTTGYIFCDCKKCCFLEKC